MTDPQLKKVFIRYSIEQFTYEIEIEYDQNAFQEPRGISEAGDEIVNDAYAGRETTINFGNTYLKFVNGVLSGTTSHLQNNGHFEINIRMIRNKS